MPPPCPARSIAMPVLKALAAQAISTEVLRERYAWGQERTSDDIARRVAGALAQAEAPALRAHWQTRFVQALRAGFVPAGRIQAAAGTGLQATLINCFVQPVGDADTPGPDGHPGLPAALAEVAQTLRRGGGVGLDFSPLRPRDARLDPHAGGAPGPVSALHAFDRSCQAIASTGARPGALMGVLRCDHPDIEAFIHAKDGSTLKSFNLSVGVTDAFIAAVQADSDFRLVHPAEPGPAQKRAGAYQVRPEHAGQDRRPGGPWVYRSLPARALWDQIMRSTYDHAEPGVLFLDTINRDNNLGYCETLSATNPCGEQPLPPYGACCLGSIDLTRMVRDPFEATAHFDEAAFADLARVAVRMLDNVLDLSPWPLPQQQAQAHGKRRIGLGFTGLGDALVMLNLRYDTEPARAAARRIATLLRDTAYDASVELARERGAFPLFDAERYLRGTAFAARLPAALRERIRTHGLRNSHLLSIAPAGSISLAFANNASNGIEPPFGWRCVRVRHRADGSIRSHTVEDPAWRLYRHLYGPVAPLTPAFVTALEMSATAHLAMVAAVAPFIDASISKTVNLPADCPYADFKDLYLHAWRAGLKGLTTYRPNRVRGPVLSAVLPDTLAAEGGQTCRGATRTPSCTLPGG